MINLYVSRFWQWRSAFSVSCNACHPFALVCSHILTNFVLFRLMMPWTSFELSIPLSYPRSLLSNLVHRMSLFISSNKVIVCIQLLVVSTTFVVYILVYSLTYQQVLLYWFSWGRKEASLAVVNLIMIIRTRKWRSLYMSTFL